MAINGNFYSTINSLVSYWEGKEITVPITDYWSFVDAGKTLQQMQATDLQNGFLNPLMNKVALTVDTFRAFEPIGEDLYKGSTNGGIVEMLSHVFYAARVAPFINLQNTNDDAAFVFSKPDIIANYYTDEQAWQIPISITDTELRAAWTSPERMDAFIQTILGDVANSGRLQKQVLRINTINAQASQVLTNATPVTAANKTGEYVKLVTVYNATHTPTVTAADCLDNVEFVRWAVSYINMFKRWMTQPADDMNRGTNTTFTPGYAQRTKISTTFDSAITRSLVMAYNEQRTMLEDYEALPYFYDRDNPDSIVKVDTADPANNANVRVAAMLYDDYALGEYVNLEDVTSMYNGMKKYTTYYYNYIYRYIRNNNANFVVFTLE